MSDDSKVCTRCGQRLPLAGFHRDARVPDGRRSECKACTRAAKRPAQPKPKPVAVLVLADVITTPQLPGALCVGRYSLFDPADRDDDRQLVERLHAEAVTLCRQCPALAQCTQWFHSLPPTERPAGVVAGRRFPEDFEKASGEPTETSTSRSQPS